MARASANSLAKLAGLLQPIRAIKSLTETRPGIFYLKREPMLHFHEEHGVTFAHMKLAAGDFDRFAVNTSAEQKALVRELQQRCAARLAK